MKIRHRTKCSLLPLMPIKGRILCRWLHAICLHMHKTSSKIYKKLVTLVASSKRNCMDRIQSRKDFTDTFLFLTTWMYYLFKIKNIKKKKAHKHMKNVNLLSSQLPSFWKEPSFSRPQNSTLLVTFDSLQKKKKFFLW